MDIQGNYHVSGNAAAKTIILPEGSVVDADIAVNAAIAATKCASLQQVRYSQSQTADVVDDVCHAHVVRRPSEVIAVEVTPVVPPTTPTPGITITTLVAGGPDVNEIQLLTLYGTFSGGAFTLTFAGQTTGAISPVDNAATIKTLLEALSNIGSGDLTVTGTLSGGMSIEFGGTLAGTNVALLIADVSGLTGASRHADVSTTTPGVSGDNQTVWVSANDTSAPGNPLLTLTGDANVTAGTFDLTYNVGSGDVTLSNLDFDISLVDLLQLIWDDQDGGLPVLMPRVAINDLALNASYSGTFAGVGKWGLKTVTNWSIDSTNLVGGSYAAAITQGGQGAINNLGGTWRLRVNGGSYTVPIATAASAAAIQTAIEALTEVGSGNVIVTQHYRLDGNGSQQGLILIEFNGDHAGTDLGPITVDTASITSGIVEVWEFLDGDAGTNEVQTLTMTGTPTQGSVAVTFDGETATLPYNCSAANADTLLESLSTIGAGGVSVSGGPWPGTPLVVTFNGNGLQFSDVPEMTTNNEGLWSSIATTQTATAGVNERQQIALTGPPTGGTFTLTFSGQTTATIAPTANAAAVKTALEDLSNIATNDLTVTGTLSGGMSIEFGGSLAKTNVSQMTGNAGGLTAAASTYTVDVGVVTVSDPTFASLLAGPVTINASSAARTPIAATIASPNLQPGDVIVIEVDATSGADQGTGLNVIVHVASHP